MVVGQYEGAREPIQQVMTASLKKRNRYELVIGHDQVKAAFESSPEVRDALVGFYAKLEPLGQSDKDAAVMLGQALQAEALLVVKVNSWEYTREEGDNLAKVSFGLRLIDANQGTIVWKARHAEAKSYLFFKPKLKNVAAALSDDMIKHRGKTFDSRSFDNWSDAEAALEFWANQARLHLCRLRGGANCLPPES